MILTIVESLAAITSCVLEAMIRALQLKELFVFGSYLVTLVCVLDLAVYILYLL
jgi:hypothetical protein